MTTEIRELLELAAQAHGSIVWIDNGNADVGWWNNLSGGWWNPLTSGDDLINLMDKLSIDVRRDRMRKKRGLTNRGEIWHYDIGHAGQLIRGSTGVRHNSPRYGTIYVTVRERGSVGPRLPKPDRSEGLRFDGRRL